nr:MAG TPA: hypothetical protein [Caudoviricetes sp.]
MGHYDPAGDPDVINGVQEAYGFRIGDLVDYTNPNGLTFGPHKVVGFVQNPDPAFLPDNTVYIDSDSPWYPVKPSSLRKAGSHHGGTKAKRTGRPTYPERGRNCEYTEDCMWGVDGWCDRPPGNKCEIQKMDEASEKEARNE